MVGRRFAALLLVFLLASASVSNALAQQEPADAQGDMPDYVMMGLDLDSSGRQWGQNGFFKAMQERTGIQFQFRQYNDLAAYRQAKDLAFASGDLPDVFFKGFLSAQEEMRYLASGQLIDLAPYLETDAPALSAILTARPDWRAIVTQPSGGIAALPSLNGYERQVYIWINKAWLDTLELSMPGTLADYEEALRAFATKDPNGNVKADEVPLSLVGPWEARFFLHAFGLTPNDYNLYVDDAGTVQFAPLQPAYRDFVDWLVRMQAEGLLDANAFRQGQTVRATTLSELQDLVLGSFVTMAPYTLLDLEKSQNYAVLPPLEYEGTRQYRRFLTGVVRGTFAITSACEQPEALLQWADFLYTEEGGRLATAGVEGEDYSWNENGTWTWSTDDFTYASDILRDRVIRTDLATPGLDPADFQRRTDVAAESYARRQGDAIQGSLVLPFPIHWPTDEAREAEIASLQAALGQAVDEAIARFAMGETEWSEQTWQAFQDELRELGADRFVELWQQIYEETSK